MFEIQPPQKVEGHVSRVLVAGGDDFFSVDQDRIEVNYEGIVGDFHVGISRKSGGREPWYQRGSDMRNERQISIVSQEELVEVANRLDIKELDAGVIGANLVLEGISNLTYLPPRTLLFFEGGATLRVDGFNPPCRIAGARIAEDEKALAGPDGDYEKSDMAQSFVQAAYMKRGLVAWVEKAGIISAGQKVTARIWQQWIYKA